VEQQRPRIGAAVLIEKDGRFLLGLRNKQNAFGTWVIPGGGVGWGETIQDAAVREIKEETNIDVEIVRFIGHKEIINLPGSYHSVVFYYLAKPKHMDVKASDDISEARFFSIEEIKKLPILESVQWVLQEAGFWK
jgi:8-oxo-dGTP diphosphatase